MAVLYEKFEHFNFTHFKGPILTFDGPTSLFYVVYFAINVNFSTWHYLVYSVTYSTGLNLYSYSGTILTTDHHFTQFLPVKSSDSTKVMPHCQKKSVKLTTNSGSN
jgi:hypothetical protein